MSGLELAAPEKNRPNLRFEGAEHTAIGDDTLLRFAKDAPAIAARHVELHLSNGLAVTSMAFPDNPSVMAPPLPSACNALAPHSTRWRCCRRHGRKHRRSWR